MRYAPQGGEVVEKIFPKTRPDDFYREMLHIDALLAGRIRPDESPVSLASGVNVMEVLAAAHKHRNQTVEIRVSSPMTKRPMEILGVIPARGGSKGIPRKNIRMLNGKPLIAWTIEAAKRSKLLTRVIVSTDDQEIADIARSYGAEVSFLRPADISHDLATDVQFLNHALDFLKEKEGYEPDIVLRLPPTSPLRTAEHIDQGIEVLLAHPEADASRPMTEAPKHPYKMWKQSSEEGYVEPFLPFSFTQMEEPFNMPRQILPKVFVHTGAMDVMRLRTSRELKSTSGKKLAYFRMSAEDSVNIDHITDFDLAELLMKRREASSGGPV